ncbi:MAG: hypothetical protein ACNA7E_10495 [Wenzhouxiangellaceae bacterium]
MLTVLIPAPVATFASEPALIDNMTLLQRFSHKLDLSIRHRNAELVDFYAHEIEETLADTMRIDEYHGKPIGELAGAMLQPALERFERALESGDPPDWDTVEARFDDYVAACNACHQATEFGFIRIRRTEANPFMQDFSLD